MASLASVSTNVSRQILTGANYLDKKLCCFHVRECRLTGC